MTLLKRFAMILAIGSIGTTLHATILFQHAFGAGGTPQACTSCLPQLNRVWDAFDLSSSSTITAIEALLGFAEDYPSMGTTSIEYSIWSSDRTQELFAQQFLPSQLSIATVAIPSYHVTASLPGVHLGPGTYFLSIYNGSQVEALGWNLSPDTIHARSVQTLGPSEIPQPIGTSASGRDLAFRVIGQAASIPEPSTWVLLSIGVALLALRRAPTLRAASLVENRAG